MNTFTTRFAGFDHDATELSAYIFSIDTFIIGLKNEEIIRFSNRQSGRLSEVAGAPWCAECERNAGVRWCITITFRKGKKRVKRSSSPTPGKGGDLCRRYRPRKWKRILTQPQLRISGDHHVPLMLRGTHDDDMIRQEGSEIFLMTKIIFCPGE